VPRYDRNVPLDYTACRWYGTRKEKIMKAFLFCLIFAYGAVTIVRQLWAYSAFLLHMWGDHRFEVADDGHEEIIREAHRMIHDREDRV